MGYINDRWSLLGGEEIEDVLVQCKQNNNVEFFQTQYVHDALDFHSHDILGIQAVCNINLSKQINLDYCSFYDFYC